VHEMRSAQKDYFDRRTQSALYRAKDLEKRVDREVLQMIGDQIALEQGTLFGGVQGRH
jgi:tetrahydromethanopterin S-methyltransferase subunit G